MSMGAIDLFDVEHSSVKITLEDDHAKKEMWLSPVMLAYWSDFFAARYKPGNVWTESTLRVPDVETAVEVLREFYIGAACEKGEWAGRDPKWIIGALRLLDEWQVNSQFTRSVVDMIKKRLNTPDLVLEHLREVIDLRATSLGDTIYFKRALDDIFRVLDPKLGTDWTGKLMTIVENLPVDLRPDYLRHLYNNSLVAVREPALQTIAVELAGMTNPALAKPYLQMILSVRDFNISTDKKRVIMKELSLIKVDEDSDSLILRTRDALAVRLHGGYPRVTKRRRSAVEEEEGDEILEDEGLPACYQEATLRD